MSHCRRTPHEDAGDTAVLAGAQSPPDGDQFPGVDPGSGYDGKHDRIEPQRRSSYSVGEGGDRTGCSAPLGRWCLTINRQTHSRRYAPNVRLLRSTGCSLSVTADVRAKGSPADVPDNRPLSDGSVCRAPVATGHRKISCRSSRDWLVDGGADPGCGADATVSRRWPRRPSGTSAPPVPAAAGVTVLRQRSAVRCRITGRHPVEGMYWRE